MTRKRPDITVSVRDDLSFLLWISLSKLVQTRHNYEINYPYEWGQSFLETYGRLLKI